LVVSTGKNTEFGAIFMMMNEIEATKSPLQNKMDQLGKQLSLMSVLQSGIMAK
jgi:Ca2+-transporting ATPase